jgi:hypothetical protein
MHHEEDFTGMTKPSLYPSSPRSRKRAAEEKTGFLFRFSLNKRGTDEEKTEF